MSLHKYSGYNSDILPVPLEKRNWGTKNYLTLWTTNVHNIAGYLMIGGLFAYQIPPLHFIFLVFVSGVLVAFAMSTSSHAGAKYGIPFVMLLRHAYGHKGALIPSFVRNGIVAVLWLALQTYVGSIALIVIFTKISPEFIDLAKGVKLLGLPVLDITSYFLCILLNLYFAKGGSNKIKQILPYINLAIFVMFSGMTIWIINQVGYENLLSTYQYSDDVDWLTYLIVINSILAVWAAPLVSSSDFSRFAKTNKAQYQGQSIGLILSYSLMAISGISILAGYSALYNQDFWNVLDVILQFDSIMVVSLSASVLIMATTITNVTTNIYPATQELIKLYPKLSYKKALTFIALLSALVMPWELMKFQDSIIYFLNLIGSLLGPVYGVIICHYLLIKNKNIDLDAIYGKCVYPNSSNKVAIYATLSGFIISVSGHISDSLSILSELSWLSGVFSSVIVYYILFRMHPHKDSTLG